MKEREEVIQGWIDARRENGQEPTQCMFHITVPRADVDLYKDETIKKVEEMLDRNHVTYGHVDTVPGAWNLNRDWVETGLIPCYVEFCGVYPVNWDIHDVAEFERMETEGEIITRVNWFVDGEYILNN